MLKLCGTCMGRGLVKPTDENLLGVCPTCECSGFSNATAAEAWQAELTSRRPETTGKAAA